MKVLLAASIGFPYGHASVNRMVTYGKGFIYHGVDAEMVFFASLADKKFKISKKSVYHDVPYTFLHKNIYRRKIKLLRIINALTGLIKLFFFLIKEKKKEKELSLILFSTDPKVFRVVGYYCKTLNIEYILEVCEYPFSLKEKSLILGKEQLIELKRNYSYFNGIIFETNRLEKFYKKFLSNTKTIVIPTTMEYEDIVEREKNIIKSDKNYIAYCGSISSEEKDGLKIIITAFNSVSKFFPTINLFFIGRIANKKYYQELLKLSKELGLNSKVFFSGMVDRKQYVDYLLNAKILLVAKGKNSFYSGGLSSKVVEYLFSKNPVVLLSSDEFFDYLKDNKDAFFVLSNSSEDLANKLIYILKNYNMAKNVAENAYKVALKTFNYKFSVKKLIDFITQ